MGGSELRRSCIEHAEAARDAGYAPTAVQEAIRAIEQALASAEAGPRIAGQVGELLEAGNADRAIRLLEQMPIRSRWLVPVIVAASLVAAGGLAFAIYAAVSSTVEQAKRGASTTASGGPASASRPDPAFDAMETVAFTFVDHLRHGRTDPAYGLMTPAYRSAVPIDRFRTAAANPYFRAATSVAVLRSKSSGGATTVEAVLKADDGDITATFHMSRGPDGYGLTGVTLGGAPALPGLVP